MKFFYQAWVMFVIIVFPACVSHMKHTKLSRPSLQLSALTPYKILLEGIECRLCAQEVERIFSKENDFYGVKFVHFMGNYEKGYLACQVTRGGRNINVHHVSGVLALKDFTCRSIEGHFMGMFVERDGARLFTLHDQQEAFLVSHSFDIYEPVGDAYWEQFPKNTVTRIQAKVARNGDGIWWIACRAL